MDKNRAKYLIIDYIKSIRKQNLQIDESKKIKEIIDIKQSKYIKLTHSG